VRTSADETQRAPALRGNRRRVLEFVAIGCSTKQIAARLGISERTVKWHVAGLFQQFGAPNRPALVREAMRQGVVHRRIAVSRE